jgi:L-ascorbate metabolism protein UlaG (beta-lactamase superfamily)
MDHITDVPTFAESTVIATPEVATFVAEEYGATDSVFNFGMNVGGTVRAGDAYVTMHGAAHTNELGTDYGDRSYEDSGGIPVSYTISDENPSDESVDDGKTFYHAGDTALTVEMREVIGTHYAPDAAAVPIGGCFTMGPKQAAIAVDWLDVDHAFPMHYDTTPPIEQEPALFARKVARTGSEATVHELNGGESFTL